MGIKLIHTADLHLSEKKAETIVALDEILRIAKEEKADIVTISGDMFDSTSDAENLRPQLRERFSDNDFEIIVIPGNHDVDVYSEGYDFGNNFIPMTKYPFQEFKKDNVNLLAVPYVESLTNDVLSKIKNQTRKDKINILLLHCTLDIGFCKGDFGEKETKYCPISQAMLAKLSFDYVLSGHFHKETKIIKLTPSSSFIYPGSPVSLTEKELGKRNVILIEIDNKEARKIPMNSFYYDKLFVNVIPGKEKEAIFEIKEWIKNHTSEKCNLEIYVDGFIQVREKDFRMSLPKSNENVKVILRHKGISKVKKHPLYMRFKEKLLEMELTYKQEIDRVVIEVMSELIADKKVRD